MPLPLLFIGTAVATGMFGAGKTTKAVLDNTKANSINTSANKAVDDAKMRLEKQREEVSSALQHLGEEIIRNIFRAGHRKRPIFDEPAWKIFPLNRVAGRP